MIITRQQLRKIISEMAAKQPEALSARFHWEVVDLGPMMYDIAMELAGDDGLISDSGGTSVAAQRVWDYYLANRVGVDVEVRDLAPRICGRDDRDNLAFRSKAYYKKSGTPSVIDHLKSLGKLRYL